ncbi:MAG TPA: RNA polymerase sigma factor [Urbifossiella sp.]|nr:RNA polymerase sigma factor [Urbifossiella sp.]
MRHALAGILRRAVAAPADARLLDDFLAGRDPDAAFAALVARHGPVVRAACRRALGDTPDADDAFQATFVVLARRAADVWPREAVGAWLYGVAGKVARKARAVRDRRRAREQPLAAAPEPAAPPEPTSLCDALDRAVRALPEVYRAAVVACDLQGLSRAEAAAALGWKEGTLSGRLARARELLARRLTRGGFTLPAGGLAAVLGVPAPVGADLLARTAAHWRGRAAGVPAPVAALTDGVTAAVLPAKAVAAAVLVLAAGVWAAARQDDPPPLTKAPPPAKAPAAPPVVLPEGRFEAIYLEAQLLAAELKHAARPKTADGLQNHYERVKLRADAIRQLAEQSQTELDALGVRAKEAAAGAKGELLDARVALEFVRRTYVGMRDYEPIHHHDLLFAETRVIRARERVAALEKSGAAAGAGVVVRGADGTDIFPVGHKRDQFDAFAADVLATCRTEVKDGAPAAEWWAAARKAGHVRVRYAEPRSFAATADRPPLTAEEFLIPATADRDPDVVLTRHGTTYRAFAGWRAEWAKDLRGALRGEP